MRTFRNMPVRLALVAGLILCARTPAIAQSTVPDDYVVFGDEQVKFGAGVIVSDGDLGSNGTLILGRATSVAPSSTVAAAQLRLASAVHVQGHAYYNGLRVGSGAQIGTQHLGVGVPILSLPALPPNPGAGPALVVTGSMTATPGSYGSIDVLPGGNLALAPGNYDVGTLRLRGSGKAPATLSCQATGGDCTIFVAARASLGANYIGLSGGRITVAYMGSRTMKVGRSGGIVKMTVYAPFASVQLKSSGGKQTSFEGHLYGREVRVGSGAQVTATGTVGSCGDNVLQAPVEECDGLDAAACPGRLRARLHVPGPTTSCGDGVRQPPAEDCDGADDALCPGVCQPNCQCPPPAGTPAVLHAVGPSVLNNATSFGVQIFGDDFLPGAELELSDKATSAIITTLPTTWVSYDRDDRAGAGRAWPVPTGIQRELVAKVINPGAPKSAPPDIGHCQTDTPTSPTACTTNADCPPGTGTCVNGDQRLTHVQRPRLPEPELRRGRARARTASATTARPARARRPAPASAAARARRSST